MPHTPWTGTAISSGDHVTRNTADLYTSSTFLDDGYQALIAPFGNDAIEFYEKTITPPGLDAGDKIDTTTMHNATWRTFAPRSLYTLTTCTVTAAYDPDLYNEIIDLKGVNDIWTVTFSDGSQYTFWGILKDFIPGEMVEGAQPEATVTIEPTNQDNNGDEQGPLMTAQYGT